MNTDYAMDIMQERDYISKLCNLSKEFCNVTLDNLNLSFIGNHSQQKSDGITSIPGIKFFCYCLYCLIFVIGLFGNSVVCYAVFRNKAMRNATNLFIVNLAVSDIMLCIFATFFTPLYIFMKKWILGAALCHVIPYAQGLTVYVSSFTLMAIAIERFISVAYPFEKHISNTKCGFIILIIWISSAVLTSPFGVYMSIVTSRSDNHYCVESWPSDIVKKVCVICTTIVQFILPFMIVTYCYSKIFLRLRYRAMHQPGIMSAQRMREETRRNTRVNKMLISMVVVFGMSWLPINIFNIIVDFYPPIRKWVEVHSVFIVTHILAMSSSCYNPILYAWLNDNFKQEFKSMIASLKEYINCKCPETCHATAAPEEPIEEIDPRNLHESLDDIESYLRLYGIHCVRFNRVTETIDITPRNPETVHERY